MSSIRCQFDELVHYSKLCLCVCASFRGVNLEERLEGSFRFVYFQQKMADCMHVELNYCIKLFLE